MLRCTPAALRFIPLNPATVCEISSLLRARPRFTLRAAKPHLPLSSLTTTQQQPCGAHATCSLAHNALVPLTGVGQETAGAVYGRSAFARAGDDIGDPSFISTALGSLRTAPTPTARAAAVLLPLCLDGGVPSVLFIQRSRSMRHHRGQAAFPGGMLDSEDCGDPVTCAVRECVEEIGLGVKPVLSSAFFTQGAISRFVPVQERLAALSRDAHAVQSTRDLSVSADGGDGHMSMTATFAMSRTTTRAPSSISGSDSSSSLSSSSGAGSAAAATTQTTEHKYATFTKMTQTTTSRAPSLGTLRATRNGNHSDCEQCSDSESSSTADPAAHGLHGTAADADDPLGTDSDAGSDVDALLASTPDLAVLGLHHDCSTSERHRPDGTVITPVIGLLAHDVTVTRFALSQAEIGRVFCVPLEALADQSKWGVYKGRPSF